MLHFNMLLFFSNLPFIDYFLMFINEKVVLEVQENGELVTSDDPPVVLGCLNAGFIQEVCVKCNYCLKIFQL